MSIEQQAAALVAKHGVDAVLETFNLWFKEECRSNEISSALFVEHQLSGGSDILAHAAILAARQQERERCADALACNECNAASCKRGPADGPCDRQKGWRVALADALGKVPPHKRCEGGEYVRDAVICWHRCEQAATQTVNDKHLCDWHSRLDGAIRNPQPQEGE